MKGVQCYELFGGIALKNHTFSFSFNLLAVSIKTSLQVEPFTSFHHFLFARFGYHFSDAVACNHFSSRVNFLHLAKIKAFIRSRPSKTLTLLIIILSGEPK